MSKAKSSPKAGSAPKKAKAKAASAKAKAKTKLPELPPEEHEALCTRCGKCCYKKVIIGRTVFITPFPCEFLDTDTNTCTVYDRRHELNPECLNMEDGIKHSAFPADCDYVPVLAPANYRPAQDKWDWDGEWDDFDGLADDLDVPKEVREKVRARGPHAPPMWVEANERIQREKEGLDPDAPTASSGKGKAATPTPKKPSIWNRTKALIELARKESLGKK